MRGDNATRPMIDATLASWRDRRDQLSMGWLAEVDGRCAGIAGAALPLASWRLSQSAALRWSAWAWVSSIQSICNPVVAMYSSRRWALPVLTRAEGASKSSTGSMIAARRVAGSMTTCDQVEVAG